MADPFFGVESEPRLAVILLHYRLQTWITLAQLLTIRFERCIKKTTKLTQNLPTEVS